MRFVYKNKIIWIPSLDGDENQHLIIYNNQQESKPRKTQSEIDELEIKFNNLDFVDRMIFSMSMHKSYREISYQLGISTTSIHHIVNHTKKVLRNEYSLTKIHEFKKSHNKIYEKCRKLSKNSDNFYFLDLINQLVIE